MFDGKKLKLFRNARRSRRTAKSTLLFEMAVSYKLLPQLTKAGDNGGLSRVVSVLAAGRESNIYVDDLALQKNYSMRTCMNHSATMNSFAAEVLAKTNPKTVDVERLYSS